MRHIDNINLKKELSDADLLRLLNFCETEFGYYGEYQFNNTEGLMELIDSFEFNTREIIDMLYKNKYIKIDDDFLYYNGGGRQLKTENRKDNIDAYVDRILHNISNGELKEMIQDCLQEEICFDR